MSTSRKFDHAPTNFKFTNEALLNDASYSKGTGFSVEEREKFKLRGLLPPKVETQEQQAQRAYEQFSKFAKPIDKYIYLMSLQDRNETLFYKLLTENLVEMLPIVYTPTVGEACTEFGHLWRARKGMYLSIFSDKGEVRKILDNWTRPDPDIIVVTDGSRILGLGDLGTNGMGIPIGKLSLYVAAAGFHPNRTLPITLDVGTNNEKLLGDKLYLGTNHKRIRGPEFYEFMDEFLMAVKDKWPNTLVQFEDFSNDVCFDVLEKNQNKLLCFNDDIQGTGAVIVSGFINAAKLSGTPLKEQKIVFSGAGSAAVGVADQIATVIHLKSGITMEEARKKIYLIDTKGLVTKHRGDELPKHKEKYARDDIKENIAHLEDVVKKVKPTALIGLSGVGKSFTKPIIEEMKKNNERPIIFALSNPTSNSECSAAEAYEWTDGAAIFASGSPFPNFEYKGKLLRPGQGNNMYIFPGLGLGAVIAKSSTVSDTMVLTAATTLAELTTEEHLSEGKIYPDLTNIRSISAKIACAVAKQSFKEGLSQYSSEQNWEQLVTDFTYNAEYVKLQPRSKL